MDRAELERTFLARMETAWEEGGVGTHNAGDGYVQWAMYEPGLQIECVSNAFLETDQRLGFVERRALVELGFAPPIEDWPNYYRRFEDRSELPVAAHVLAAVVFDVLGESETPAEPPAPGHVCIVVPVGKCSSQVLQAVINAVIPPLAVRRELTVMNAFGDGLF
ncbi:MAG: hypothetical protein M3P04_08290, partial [Actinomycetota bacterium]|nr:hypothetical protein [Actinomycetota bacterium]